MNKIGGNILDAAITVHRELGAGLLESAYEIALMHELTLRNLTVRRHVPVEVIYKGCNLSKCYEIDLLVENKVIVEIKSVLDLNPVFTAQVLTYLKLSQLKLGYLINFNIPYLKDGFKRIVYNF
ncbi:MAG: GxxExxY protein [Flavisolibacter sp.]